MGNVIPALLLTDSYSEFKSDPEKLVNGPVCVYVKNNKIGQFWNEGAENGGWSYEP